MTEYRSLGALREHHRHVLATVLEFVEVLKGPPCGASFVPLAELVAYLGTEVLPRVLAEENTVVDAANRLGALRARNAILIEGYRHLLEGLRTLVDAAAAAIVGGEVHERALRYVDMVIDIVTEEEWLLGTLLENGRGLDLGTLDAAVRERLQAELAFGEASGAGDLEVVLLGLVPLHREHLGEAAEGQVACRRALALWPLASRRPDASVALTEALRLVGEQARVAGSTSPPVNAASGARSFGSACSEEDG